MSVSFLLLQSCLTGGNRNTDPVQQTETAAQRALLESDIRMQF
jgi:hypothetical protein